MDVLFENKTTRTSEYSKDVCNFLHFKRPSCIVMFVVTTVFTIHSIAKLIITNNPMYFLPIILFIMWFVIYIILYKKNSKLIVCRDAESHGKPVDITLSVTEDAINCTTSTGANTHLYYADIKKVYNGKKYVFIISDAQILYAFKKDAFTAGNVEDFIKFIKNKIKTR